MIEVRYNFPDIVAAFTLDDEDAQTQCCGSVARLAIQHVEYGARSPRDDGEDAIMVEIVPTTRKIAGVEHRPQVRIL